MIYLKVVVDRFLDEYLLQSFWNLKNFVIYDKISSFDIRFKEYLHVPVDYQLLISYCLED